MTTREKLLNLKARTYANATECIMPFWRDYVANEENGGFYGAVDKYLRPIKDAPLSAVVTTRMLWGYANAYEKTGDEAYARLAKRAFEYLIKHFWDETYGGVYWMVGPKGDPFDVVKRTYAQACFLYAAAEYYLVFKDSRALNYAMETFELVNRYARHEKGGYLDSLCRDWQEDAWVRTWFMNGHGCPKLLNSHLHLFEGTALLFRATGDEKVRAALKDFMDFLLDHCVEYDRGCLKAGMDYDLNRIDTEIAFGHDLECAYLMEDAARTLGDKALYERTRQAVLMLSENALNLGYDREHGGMFSDMDAATGRFNRSKIWWVQCESITGFLCAYELSHDEKYVDAACGIWDYVEKHMADREKGEWLAVGTHDLPDAELVAQDKSLFVVVGDEKMNKTKCPYHNSRACFGVSERVDRILAE